MALLSDYVSGTISVAANGTAVTGVGTAWLTAGFQEGDLLFANGFSGVVLAVNSNTSMTLAQPWRGGALNASAYRLRYQGDGSRVSAQARQLIELLGAGNIAALSALVGAASKLPYFTGAATMDLIDLSDRARGFLTKQTAADAQTAIGVTDFARGLLDDTTIAEARDTLGISNFVKGLLDAGTAASFYNTLGPVPIAQIRGDLGPDKSYRQGNILGSVGQSSGSPSGALIERGSNGNGEYVRFADGTQICTRVVALGTTTIQPNAFESLTSGLSFAAAFAAAPTVAVSYDGAFSYQVLMATPTPSASSTNNIYAKNTDTVARALNGSYRLVAVGRWF